MKHVELDLFFVREKVTQDNVVVNHVPTSETLADSSVNHSLKKLLS